MLPELNHFIKNAVKDGIRVGLGKATKFRGGSDVNLTHKRLYPDARVINSAEWMPQIFKAYYGELDVAQIIPGSDVSVAQSWIPFQKSGTRIFIYNFFEANYGIRDPILFRAYLLDGSGQVVSVRSWLAAGSTIINSTNPWSDRTSEKEIPSTGSLVVQAFHPRIKTASQQLRFFGFYGPSSQAPTCAVHALAIPARNLLRPLNLGYRCYGTSNEATMATLTQSELSLKADGKNALSNFSKYHSGTAPLTNGFIFQRDPIGHITGVWHDGPTSHLVAEAPQPKKTGGTIKTALFVPDFQKQAPLLYVAANQIGFRPEELSIQLFGENGEKVAEEKIKMPGDEIAIDTKEIFARHLRSTPTSIVVDTGRDVGDFTAEPPCYVHVYYRSTAGFSDQGHSYHSYGYSNAPNKRLKSYRCRKFAPYFKSEFHDVFISIHNVGGKTANKDELVYLRTICDTGYESRVPLKVPGDRVSFFNVEELLSDFAHQIKESAVLQLEHATSNYNGSWYFVDRRTGSLATDHFTGG